MLSVNYAECHLQALYALNVVMLNVIMLSVIMLSVIMLSVIMLSAIILSVVAPCSGPHSGRIHLLAQHRKQFFTGWWNGKLT